MEGKSRHLYYQTVTIAGDWPFVQERFANVYVLTNIYATFTKVPALNNTLSVQSVQLSIEKIWDFITGRGFQSLNLLTVHLQIVAHVLCWVGTTQVVILANKECLVLTLLGTICGCWLRCVRISVHKPGGPFDAKGVGIKPWTL